MPPGTCSNLVRKAIEEGAAQNDRTRLERIVLDSCAPVIFGVKPSNMVSVDKKTEGFDEAWFAGRRRIFAKSGILSYTLCSCDRRVLMLFYRADMLGRCLQNREAVRILKDCGYRMGGLRQLLGQLAERVRLSGEFPHEIGLFLGYPVRDVEAFIENKGRGGVACGYWKVYYDKEEALRSFELYDRVRKYTADMITEGQSLSNILINGGKYNENVDNLLLGNG